MSESEMARNYGAAILGNCCGEGEHIVRACRTHPRVKLVGGFESGEMRGEELARALGQPLAKSGDQLLADPAVDFVALACDAADKARWLRQAAEAHKHVLFLPPMCDSLSAARSVIAAMKSSSIKCVQDVPLVRFNPAFARLLVRVRTEPLGKVFSYYHNLSMNFTRDFDVAAKWPELLGPRERMAGGEIATLGSHAIDLALALLGRPPRVQAKWRLEWPAYRKAKVEHFGQLILDYGGFFAFLAVGRQQLDGGFNHGNWLHVVAESQTLTIDGAGGAVLYNNVPMAWEQYVRDFAPETGLDQLVRCLDQDSAPDSSVEIAADAMEVIMAAYRSILEERVIELPLGEGANPLG